MILPNDILVIIPTLATQKTKPVLSRCYRSLTETTIRTPLSISVVVNGIYNVINGDIKINQQGQCIAVNAAAQTTNHPWILVTNDDMVYPERWLENLLAGLSEEMLCISPKLVEPNSGAPTFEVFDCGGINDFNEKKWNKFAEEYEGQGIRTGFNLPFLIRRDLWDLIGGYDINFDPFGSNGDSDLEYKIKLAGVQPYQNTNCIVYHFSQTSGTFLPENDSYRFRNYAYFREKWGFNRTDDGIWEATFDIPKSPERVFTPDYEGKYSKKN